MAIPECVPIKEVEMRIADEMREKHHRRVLDVLEKRGVEFIENGVRLTRRPRR
jgi:hypothetical protein